MKPKILSTKRLILRRANENDSKVLFDNYFSDPYSSTFLTRKPHSHIDQTKKFLKEWCQIAWDEGSDKFAWVIALADSNEGIGVFLVELDNISTAQIHYGICSHFSRKGLMTEAGDAIVSWLTIQENIQRIWTACDLSNLGSIRVLEKLGFQNEGVQKEWLTFPALSNLARDCYIFAFNLKKCKRSGKHIPGGC